MRCARSTSPTDPFPSSQQDQLQSLFLHRIDTIQTLLSQTILAEQTTLSRLELRLSGAIGDCAEVDSVADLVAFAEGVTKRAATDRRRMSVQGVGPSASAGGGGGKTGTRLVTTASAASMSSTLSAGRTLTSPGSSASMAATLPPTSSSGRIFSPGSASSLTGGAPLSPGGKKPNPTPTSKSRGFFR